MPRSTCNFRQRDVTAAVKAVEAAGREAQRVRIDRNGCIIIDLAVIRTQPTDELDTELEEFKAQHGRG